MFFLRWLRSKAVTIILLVALVIVLKQAYPQIGQTVGGWISGVENNRVTKAVSSMVASLSDGDGLKNAVEVFRETLQASEGA